MPAHSFYEAILRGLCQDKLLGLESWSSSESDDCFSETQGHWHHRSLLAWGFEGQHEVRFWNGACTLPMLREANSGDSGVKQACMCVGGGGGIRSPDAVTGACFPNCCCFWVSPWCPQEGQHSDGAVLINIGCTPVWCDQLCNYWRFFIPAGNRALSLAGVLSCHPLNMGLSSGLISPCVPETCLENPLLINASARL